MLVKGWFRASPGLAITAIGLTLSTSLLPAGFALATGALIHALPGAVRDGLASSAGHRLVWWSVVVGGIFAVQQMVGPLRSTVIAGDLGRRVTTGLADRQTATMLAPATIAHLEDPSFLDDAARATGVGGIGPWAATTGLVQLWTSRLSGVASLLVVARYQAWHAGLLLGALMLNVTILRRKYMELVEVMNRRAPSVRRSSYLRDLAQDPAAAKELRLFGFDRWLLDSFDRSWLDAMREIWRQRSGMTLATLGAVGPLVAAFALALMALHSGIASGRMDAGSTATFVQGLLAAMSLASVARSDSWIAYGTATLPAQEHLEHRVRTDASLVLTGNASPRGLPRREIRFDAAAFTYPGSDAPVFESLDLVIPAGKSLGIVGVNGAGKTTLVKLLTRLYDPAGGRILVDGIDAKDLDALAWQQRFAVLFQDFVRYPLTLTENISLGRDLTIAQVEKSARRGGAIGLAEELPAGWDTVLSRQLGGVDLSGGQWQRLALARAFAAAEGGADILVLDEPTSQLDTRAEAAFYADFLRNTDGLTTIVISHRLAAVRQADSIAVLSHGKVVEQGSHDELLERGGTYQELFELQASRFTNGGTDA